MKNNSFLTTLILLLCLLVWQSGCSQVSHNNIQEIRGKVIKISDGDTYEILVEGNQTKKVRMQGIDAPEKGMDFSRKATDYLRFLCAGQYVTLRFTEVDQYGRLLAFTYLDNGLEASHEMVKAGYAWHFKKFNQDQDLADLETAARAEKKGLWADKYPVEPWIERKLRKKGYKSVEIKQLKICGEIETEEDAKKIPYK